MQIIQFDQTLICDDGDAFATKQSLFLKYHSEKKVLKTATTSNLRRQTMKMKPANSTLL
jgi:hypothetical protein